MIGEHIRARRAGRWVHAIDCGDETVIQLLAEAGRPSVRRCFRPEFVAGAETVEVVRHRERTFPANEVVARAYSRISDPALAAMFHDSEAFAAWCATGRLPPAPANVAVAVPEPAPARADDAAGSRTRSRARPKARRSPPRKAAPIARKRRTVKRAAAGRKVARPRKRQGDSSRRRRR